MTLQVAAYLPLIWSADLYVLRDVIGFSESQVSNWLHYQCQPADNEGPSGSNWCAAVDSLNHGQSDRCQKLT